MSKPINTYFSEISFNTDNWIYIANNIYQTTVDLIGADPRPFNVFKLENENTYTLVDINFTFDSTTKKAVLQSIKPFKGKLVYSHDIPHNRLQSAPFTSAEWKTSTERTDNFILETNVKGVPLYVEDINNYNKFVESEYHNKNNKITLISAAPFSGTLIYLH